MVQRKGPDLLGSRPESVKDPTKTEKHLYSHQNQEPKSKGGGDLKKKMKKLRSIKRISELENFESHLGQQHVQLTRTSSGRKPSSSQEPKSKEGGDLKKKMKKLRTIKRISGLDNFESHLGQQRVHLKRTSSVRKPPYSKLSSKSTSPNYMKSTTSSDARKERLEVNSPHTPGDKKRSPKKSNNLNLAEASSAPSRLNKAFKSLTRKASMKLVRPIMRKSLGALLFPNINVSGATCSSTLKDSKFPKELELTPGATEAEGTSAMKVCPYTYCSLNGHCHEPLPPLKPFLSARRRLLKTQKSMKLKSLSSFRKRSTRSIQKQIDLAEDEPNGILSSSEDFLLLEDLEDDFFIEIYTKPQEKLVESISSRDNTDSGKDFNDAHSEISTTSLTEDGEDRKETEDFKSSFVRENYHQTSPVGNLDDSGKTSISELGPQINIHMEWFSQTDLEVDSLKNGNWIDRSNTFEPYGLANNSDNDHQGEASWDSFNHLNFERNLDSSHMESQESSGIIENNDTSCAGFMPVILDSEDRSLEERKEDSEIKTRIYLELATYLKGLINEPTDQQTASVEYTTQNMVVSKQNEQYQSTEENSKRNDAIEETSNLLEIKVPGEGLSENVVDRYDEYDAKGEQVTKGCTCTEVNTKGSADTDATPEPLSENEDEEEEEEDDDDDDDDGGGGGDEEEEENSKRNNAVEKTSSLLEIKIPGKGLSENEVYKDDEDNAKGELMPEGCLCTEVNTKDSADTDITPELLLSKNEEGRGGEEDDDDGDEEENFHTFNGNKKKLEKDQFQATESYHLKITTEKSDGVDSSILDADIDKVEEQEYWLASGPISDEKIAALAGRLINSSALLHDDGKELKIRMRIAKKRVDVDSEQLKPFNPRSPNFLSLEPDPEKEKVDLRHQMMDERKNAEEWMIDYALQQAVTKLAPARKRKVALLVEAFETVMPLTTYEEPLGNNSPDFAHGRPMQACS